MFLVKFLKRYFYPHQHPDTALRYLPIVRLLRRIQSTDSILEIGSGSYGITPYLKKPVTGVDVSFSEPAIPLLHQVPATALKLPFPDSSFDTVIFSDCLEHLPAADRLPAIKEAVRVATRYIIISGPFGDLSLKQDRELHNLSLRLTGQAHPFFQEHLKYGLPQVASLISSISRLRKVKNITDQGGFLNLSLRFFLMSLFIRPGKFYYYLYLKALMPLIWIFSKFNQPPVYRRLLLIQLK